MRQHGRGRAGRILRTVVLLAVVGGPVPIAAGQELRPLTEPVTLRPVPGGRSGVIRQLAYLTDSGTEEAPRAVHPSHSSQPISSESRGETKRPRRHGTSAATQRQRMMDSHWDATGSEPVSLSGDLVRVASWTLVVIGVGVGTILLLKRMGLATRFAPAPGSQLSLQGTLMLNPKMAVHLVRTGAGDVLVAVDQRGISGVTVLPPRFDLQEPESSEATSETEHPREAWHRTLDPAEVPGT